MAYTPKAPILGLADFQSECRDGSLSPWDLEILSLTPSSHFIQDDKPQGKDGRHCCEDILFEKTPVLPR